MLYRTQAYELCRAVYSFWLSVHSSSFRSSLCSFVHPNERTFTHALKFYVKLFLLLLLNKTCSKMPSVSW